MKRCFQCGRWLGRRQRVLVVEGQGAHGSLAGQVVCMKRFGCRVVASAGERDPQYPQFGRGR